MRMLALAGGLLIIAVSVIVFILGIVGFQKSVPISIGALVLGAAAMYGGIRLCSWGNADEKNRGYGISSDEQFDRAGFSPVGIYNLDLSRISWIGWVLSLGSIALAILVAILVSQAMGIKNDARGPAKMVGVICFAGGACLFFGGRLMLKQMGYSIFKQPTKKRKKKKSSSPQGLPPKTRRPKNPNDPW